MKRFFIGMASVSLLLWVVPLFAWTRQMGDLWFPVLSDF